MQKASSLRRTVLRWYNGHRRPFSWRMTTDPYTVLVSEVMLQQTQASRVEEKLGPFLRRFPDLRRLAGARRSDVIRAWQGMGYNNRAVHLHELARIVVDRCNGKIPSDPDELLKLPGIGAYTSGAVACFAFGRRVPVVDTNVRRVLSRVFWKMPGRDAVQDESLIRKLAGEILPRDAYSWNQGLMEFGALRCTARRPMCPGCPAASICLSRGLPAESPPAHRRHPKPEPMYAGIPRRFWRGKIIQALRGRNGSAAVPLHGLGAAIKKDFHRHELPWLSGIIDSLVRDGLVRRTGSGRSTEVELAR